MPDPASSSHVAELAGNVGAVAPGLLAEGDVLLARGQNEAALAVFQDAIDR